MGIQEEEGRDEGEEEGRDEGGGERGEGRTGGHTSVLPRAPIIPEADRNRHTTYCDIAGAKAFRFIKSQRFMREQSTKNARANRSTSTDVWNRTSRREGSGGGNCGSGRRRGGETK